MPAAGRQGQLMNHTVAHRTTIERDSPGALDFARLAIKHFVSVVMNLDATRNE
jgi:hypothetical protein